MGVATVEILRDRDTPLVRKSGAALTECRFYDSTAPRLRARGVEMPRAHRVDVANRLLVLEFVPYPLAPTDYDCPDVLRQLARIHASEIPLDGVPLFSNTWTDAETVLAADCLQLSSRDRHTLKRLQTFQGTIFEPRTLLSGDANIGNWGRRQDGTVVLFDWERFSTGSPGIDLAALIPGLLPWAAVGDLARRYLACCDSTSVDPVELARQTIIAQVWLTIEVTNLLVRRRHPHLSAFLGKYRARFPGWLNKMTRHV
ncbi:phosphotransferase family protein [Arhodomonas sp. AD133]|uniref:phosphotransferase family protein n=1 Tax=Arhodomonas sp. AD133 TaxID=3415009 RepID=UPI003EBD65CE